MSNLATLRRFLSVPELAEMLAVKDTKILHWISTGELQAFNAGTSRNGRPRWRISVEAFEAFQAARASVPTSPPTQRRQRKVASDKPREWIK